MYSKYKGITDKDYVLTPPPGYDGSRFRRRSDGRDDSFPLYGDGTKRPAPPKSPQCMEEMPEPECCTEHQCEEKEDDTSLCPCREECPSPQKKPKEEGILGFLQGLGSEDILLIALIVLLANDSRAGIDTVLILALLLCIT